ncbi:MAG TPA: nitroreductase family protein, partial [Candidatus Ozemobacteraceae bacterium]|nr:nitroreductase family protein [Candidatus Ozemobacteraceae bacterium]
ANGVNRENGKRTAPAPLNMPFLQIFVAGAQGVWLYQPRDHSLSRVSEKDLRSSLPKQPAYASASHLLLLVADLSKFAKPEIATESKLMWAHCNAGHIGQNVYLAAAALDLGTCMVANVATESARTDLELRDDQFPLYLMPLGYVK